MSYFRNCRFAYIEFTTKESLSKALALNGADYAGQSLVVDEASEPGGGGGGGRGRGGFGGGRGGDRGGGRFGGRGGGRGNDRGSSLKPVPSCFSKMKDVCSLFNTFLTQKP